MKKKLQFRKETVRALSQMQLRGAAGGLTSSPCGGGGVCSRHPTSCSTFGDGGCGKTLDFSCDHTMLDCGNTQDCGF